MKKRAYVDPSYVAGELHEVQYDIQNAIERINRLFPKLLSDRDDEWDEFLAAMTVWTDDLHDVNSWVGDMLEEL